MPDRPIDRDRRPTQAEVDAHVGALLSPRPMPLLEATDDDIVQAVRRDAAVAALPSVSGAGTVLCIHGRRMIVSVEISALDGR